MRIREIMARSPVTIGPDATLAEAAERMAAGGVGGLPVVAEGQLVGIVTEADVVSHLQGGRAVRLRPEGVAMCRRARPRPGAGAELRADVVGTQPVRSIMTTDVVSVHPGATVDQVAELMVRHRIKRVPVVAWGSLVGLVSQLDLVAVVAGRPFPAAPADVRHGWRFLPPDHVLAETGAARAEPGLRLEADPASVPFERAPGAFPDIIEALARGSGLAACRVRLSGVVVGHGDREVASEWECLWVADAGDAVIAWAAAAVDLALQWRQEEGQRVDPLVHDVLRSILRAASGDIAESELIQRVRTIESQRRADVRLPGLSRALDAVLEAAQAALAARDAPDEEDPAWEAVAVAAAWDAAHQALRAMDTEQAAQLRRDLEGAVLARAPLAAGLA